MTFTQIKFKVILSILVVAVQPDRWCNGKLCSANCFSLVVCWSGRPWGKDLVLSFSSNLGNGGVLTAWNSKIMIMKWGKQNLEVSLNDKFNYWNLHILFSKQIINSSYNSKNFVILWKSVISKDYSDFIINKLKQRIDFCQKNDFCHIGI